MSSIIHLLIIHGVIYLLLINLSINIKIKDHKQEAMKRKEESEKEYTAEKNYIYYF